MKLSGSLLGVVTLFAVLNNVASQHYCNLCLILCANKAGQEGVNLPIDLPTLEDSHTIFQSMGFSSIHDSNKNATKDIFAEGKTCPYTSEDAANLLGAIDKIVTSFYKNHVDKITMRNDGGVGLGVLRGQLKYILAKERVNLYNMTPDLRNRLEKLRSLSGPLALQIVDQAIESTTDPSIKFGTMIMRNSSNVMEGHFTEWKSKEAIAKHFDEFKEIGNEKEVVYPYLDFHCLVSLINDCSVPTVCQKMYLTDIYSQYMLMHQIILQQIAERKSCKNVEAFGNVEDFRDRLCSKAFFEAQFLEKKGFLKRFVDLFAEQVGFCGLMGYPNFMRADWLREILSWQEGSKSGCVTDFYGPGNLNDARISVTTDSQEEKCLVHLTSVSLMALTMNFRYMMDVCSPDIFGV